MEETSVGICDLCQTSEKLVKSLAKDIAKILGHTYGLNIQNAAIWRLCTQCNYEIVHVIQKYLETTTTNSHPALSPDLSRCFVCGNRKVVRNHSLKTVVAKIRDTGLAIPISSGGEIYACFSCHFVVETVAKYKDMLQASQLWHSCIRPYKNLTETINTAKRSSNSHYNNSTPTSSSTNRVRSRKNARPMKLQPSIRKCVVILKKLDFNVLSEQLAGTHLDDEPAIVSPIKPVKLQKGHCWDKSGLLKGLSPPKRRYTMNYKSLVAKGSSAERGYNSDINNGRVIRKRKLANKEDFVYYSPADRVDNKFNNKNNNRKIYPKKRSTKMPRVAQIQKVTTKKCVVMLQRCKIPSDSEEETKPVPVEVLDVDMCQPQTTARAPCFESPVKEVLKENSTPNIQPVAQLSEFLVFKSSESSSSFLALPAQSSPVKSILNSPRSPSKPPSVRKSVSFCFENEVLLYTPEASRSNTPETASSEIDFGELNEYLRENTNTAQGEEEMQDLESNNDIEITKRRIAETF